MEISRYASRLARTSPVLPSGRPPQAVETKISLKEKATLRAILPFKSPLGLLQEPEDASLTGGTRSLSRRLLALNIPGLSSVSPFVTKLPGKISAKKAKVTSNLVPSSDFLVPVRLTKGA